MKITAELLSLYIFLHTPLYFVSARTSKLPSNYCTQKGKQRFFGSSSGPQSCKKCDPWTNVHESRPEAIDMDCWSCCFHTPQDFVEQQTHELESLHRSIKVYADAHDQARTTIVVLATFCAFFAVITLALLICNVIQYKHSQAQRAVQAENNFGRFEQC